MAAWLPLALLTPLLAPLRRLAARGWLREADVDGLLRHAHPLASLNRHYARVEARYWVADDMLALALRTAPGWLRRRGRASTSSCWRSATGCGSGAGHNLTRWSASALEIAVKRHPDGLLSLVVRTPGGRPACRVATRARRSALADAGRAVCLPWPPAAA